MPLGIQRQFLYKKIEAEMLVEIYSQLSVPDKVLSDQGTQFMSGCARKVCRLRGIKQKLTKLYQDFFWSPISTQATPISIGCLRSIQAVSLDA
ncbi:Zinc finger protein [Plakobranchus ocellatus]|uniref:Zinc finger protein n=1 Tax=Plakobranchus ocellatus TaxID=259542 RepID=A0AAV3ZN80_9GAST|nr:Zinc finger protein [Plakobranchus ocellatus]